MTNARRSNDALADALLRLHDNPSEALHGWRLTLREAAAALRKPAMPPPLSQEVLDAMGIEGVEPVPLDEFMDTIREPEITVTNAMLDAAIEAADNEAKTFVKDDAFAAAFGVSSVAGFLCRVMRAAIEAAMKTRET